MGYCKWIFVGLLATLASLASATTYTYTGATYASGTVAGAFTTSMQVTGWFKTASPLPANMAATTIGPLGTSPLVTDWSFSDGLSTYTSANSAEHYAQPTYFTIATDASGNISTYVVALGSPKPPYTVGQAFNVFLVTNGLGEAYRDAICDSVNGSGVCTSGHPGADHATFAAGAWVITTTAVPVPATSVPLLVLMALGLGWLVFRQKRLPW